ncbi:S8 family serine peptidase [Pedomonas mirosovicensis]|uniref:S8 family serine peptidase n=1 Tax=Pedomonas mirosovicensis TaxID=2908641 RepID=UPI0021679B6B|nr:S8 family serine peptidase [Pedomonas mirosovicensis]MCH8684767.1 S8 family serine peptidase [Pedomonas mirosovicensis]
MFRPRLCVRQLVVPFLVLLLALSAARARAADAPAQTASLPPGEDAVIVVTGRLDSSHRAELRRNWGIAAIKADTAYAAGASGRGVQVAIVDTGVDAATPDVKRVVSPRSIDLFTHRQDGEARRHGANIAAMLAAAQDGAGLVGVAPGVTVLSVRADLDQPCWHGECKLSGPDVARGIDYALDQGARVIILSLAGLEPLPSLKPAFRRAAQTGAVLVIAAGNRGTAEPTWPARYAEEPDLRDAILVVGAATREGELAIYSNRAGQAMNRYIAAPGHKVSINCSRKHCSKGSGTSFATAYAAGAVALLLDAFPRLDAQQAARILLDSAQDKDAPGVDAVSGHGHMDVARAFAQARAMTQREIASNVPTS